MYGRRLSILLPSVTAGLAAVALARWLISRQRRAPRAEPDARAAPYLTPGTHLLVADAFATVEGVRLPLHSQLLSLHCGVLRDAFLTHLEGAAPAGQQVGVQLLALHGGRLAVKGEVPVRGRAAQLISPFQQQHLGCPAGGPGPQPCLCRLCAARGDYLPALGVLPTARDGGPVWRATRVPL